MPQPRRRSSRNTGRFLLILICIFAVLVVFEGRLIVDLVSRRSLQTKVQEELAEVFSADDFQEETEILPADEDPSDLSRPAEDSSPAGKADEPYLTPEQSVPVDDSYFSDAVFIGDSRMEGFHIQSGLTQGTFLTGIGMTSANIFDEAYVTTADGNVTVFEALDGQVYGKLYIMIGTNELGYDNFEEFRKNYTNCLAELRALLPDALFYVSAVPYVEEEKVTTGSYVNNTNIDTVNEIILDICRENGYYYLNPNEVLSDGNGSLANGATSDGIHMYASYYEKWLDYLRTHYVTDDVLDNTNGTLSAEEALTKE